MKLIKSALVIAAIICFACLVNSEDTQSVVTGDSLYDDYTDDYDEVKEKTLNNQLEAEVNKQTDTTSNAIITQKRSTIVTQNSSNDNEQQPGTEPGTILGAGIGQVYSAKPDSSRSSKKMSILREKIGQVKIPDNCSEYEMLGSQPALLPLVTVPKCCKEGENYFFNDTDKGCGPQGVDFDFDLINAVFYDGCIEDKEISVNYRIKERTPCSGGVLYNENYGDLLYVLSNGSLLRVSADWEMYDIFDDYCLDMAYEGNSFVLSAISCHDVYGGVLHVSQIQGTVCAAFMMISVPCLLIVAIIYYFIPNLNDLHGKSLSFHSLCLMIGYLLLSFIQFTGNHEGIIGYVIAYFILAAFFWMLFMLVDLTMQVWRYLPNNIEPKNENKRLVIYCILSQLLPLIFVLLTYSSGYHGLPSYYFRANDSGEMASQKYFIPVVTAILILSVILAVTTEIGFRKLNKLSEFSILTKFAKGIQRQTSRRRHDSIDESHELDDEKIDKVDTMRISTNFLLGVMSITWICEIISFYCTTSQMSPILFLDIINALQGVFIFMLFVCLPRPYGFIKKYFRHHYNSKSSSKMGSSEEMQETSTFMNHNGDHVDVENGAKLKN